MAKNDNLTDFLTDVANAIREKKGTTDLINPQDFSAEIRELAGLSAVEKVSHTNLSNYMTEIASTLREVEGSSALINPQDFSQKILDIATDETDVPLYFEALEVPITLQFSNLHEYSYDNRTWNSGTSETSVSLQVGQKVYYRASGLTATSSDGIGRFTITNKCVCSGNVMSMLYGNNYKRQTTITQDYAFCNLLREQPIVTAPELPATKLSASCYRNIFRGAHLISAPSLPATTLTDYCYAFMFQDCTSLVNAPKLSATTLADSCCRNMFYGCTSLATAPELPAKELADSCCRSMFYGCTSLVTAPELPATTLAKECYYYMFYGCTSLATAPELPAKELADSCYRGMFYNCAKLSYIKALFLTAPSIGTTYTINWVYGVAPQGTFVKHRNASWNDRGVKAVPEDWKIEYA